MFCGDAQSSGMRQHLESRLLSELGQLPVDRANAAISSWTVSWFRAKAKVSAAVLVGGSGLLSLVALNTIASSTESRSFHSTLGRSSLYGVSTPRETQVQTVNVLGHRPSTKVSGVSDVARSEVPLNPWDMSDLVNLTFGAPLGIFGAPPAHSRRTGTHGFPRGASGRRELRPMDPARRFSAGFLQAEQQSGQAEATVKPEGEEKYKFVVIGGGWGGWGAAKALSESGVNAEVTLLDALPDPTGKSPYLSGTGKPVEAGTRGFWKDYPNINQLCADLRIPEYDIFTPFTNSSFYSPDGLEATAPVFSEAKLPKLPDSVLPFLGSISEQPFPQLPSPLGQVIATSQLFERIPIEDRASMIGLLLATADCFGGDEKVQMQYDRMTGHELFLRFGISKRLVDDFIRPTLLIGLFKAPEELSALVVMELLYYYALAHQDSFDVRWIRNGTVADSLIAPLASKLQNDAGLNVMGGSRVGKISLIDTPGGKLAASSVEYSTMSGETKTIHGVDGIVLALGVRGMQAVVHSSPDLAKLPVFSMAASLKGIDVISTRIWLDRVVPTRTPANVFSRFKELRGSGGTFFMLDQLQGNTEDLWGGEKPQGSVVACDFYNAEALLGLADDELIRILMDNLLPSAVPQFADAKVVDSWVAKYPGTVSWFSPGSFLKRPPTEGAGPSTLANIKFAGDWVRMGKEREKACAKGLCQERAFVSGFEAANSLLRDTVRDSESFQPHPILPVRDDEPQFKAAVAVNNQVMKYVPRFWVQ